MWEIIAICTFTTLALRVAPALFPILRKITQYPNANKFLDYTICLVIGEIIYSIAFGSLRGTEHDVSIQIACNFCAILTSIILMWYSNNVIISFITGIFAFIFSYLLFLMLF